MRAAAIKSGFAPTNIDTYTYLFLADVLQQPASMPGYPSVWAGKPAHYHMDPEIVNDPNLDDVKLITLSYTFFEVEEETDEKKAELAEPASQRAVN